MNLLIDSSVFVAARHFRPYRRLLDEAIQRGQLLLSIVRNNYAASCDCHPVPSSPVKGEDKGGGESPHTHTSTPHPDLPPQGGKEPKSEPGKPAAYFVRSVLSSIVAMELYAGFKSQKGRRTFTALHRDLQ